MFEIPRLLKSFEKSLWPSKFVEVFRVHGGLFAKSNVVRASVFLKSYFNHYIATALPTCHSLPYITLRYLLNSLRCAAGCGVILFVDMSAFTRSLSAFSRTSKLTFRSQGALNPVHRIFTQDTRTARAYATAFERTKPHVNIGTIGHVDHGKVRPERSVAQVLKADGIFLHRLLSLLLSPNDKPRKDTPSYSSMVPLTRRLKRGSEASPFPPHISSTRRTIDITPMSTVLDTRITSRT